MQAPLYLVSLHELLDVQGPQQALDWHDEILKGFDARSVNRLAQMLQVETTVLANWLGIRATELEGGEIGQQASAALHRIAVVFMNAHTKFHEIVDVAAWMGTPNPNLKDRRPIDLVRSHTGTSYVLTAIERLPNRKPKPEKDAPDLVEGDL
jgi:putative toxin-antitoxin system antitoxin component (TIGR02293 family)